MVEHFLNLNPLVRQMDVNFYLKLLMEGLGLRKISIYFWAPLMIELSFFSWKRKDGGPSKYQTLSGQKVVEATCSNINIYLFLFEASSWPIIPIIPRPCKAKTRNPNVSTLHINTHLLIV